MYTPTKLLLIAAALTMATACTLAPLDQGDDALPIDVSQEIARGALDYDSRVKGQLTARSPLDYYLFEAQAGDQSFIDAPSREGSDTYAFLLQQVDGGWLSVASNDDCSDQTRNACIHFLAETDGTYAVVVTTYQYVTFGIPVTANYELEIFCNDGPCKGIPCGSRNLAPCPDDMYCDWPDDNCGAADGPGVCREKPQFCTQQYDPVCGCDGETYGNACTAASYGVDSSNFCEPETN